MARPDLDRIHETLTRWLHYNYCYATGCEGKTINDPMYRDESFRFNAGFMTAAIAPIVMGLKFTPREEDQ